MSSAKVKNTVRDSVECGIDKLHRVTDVVTAPLAPIDGAIHGVARGVFNWLTDQHPQQTKNCKDGKNSKPACGGGGGRGQGGNVSSGGGDLPYANRRQKGITIKGNELKGNKGKNVGIKNIRNDRRASSNNGDDDDEPLDIQSNQIANNDGDDGGISDIGNKY